MSELIQIRRVRVAPADGPVAGTAAGPASRDPGAEESTGDGGGGGGMPARLLDAGRLSLLIRRGKVAALAGRRLWRWAREPAAFPRPEVSTAAADFPHLLGVREVAIARRDEAAHPVFEQGKRANLRLAAPAFDGLVLTPGRPLSFWRTLSRVTAAGGYQHGMELRGGCIVPALGGGLCLLSNALFALAAELGWSILERHGHTLEAVPGEEAVWGLDATVFWPYVDLRVAPRAGRVWLRVRVVGEVLRLEALGDRPAQVAVTLAAQDDRVTVRGGERVRENRIRRQVREVGSGRLVADEIIAENRKRLLHTHEQRRNCLTCGELACHARVELPSAKQS